MEKNKASGNYATCFFPQWRPLQIHLWHLPGLFIGLAAAVFLAAGALPVSLTHETQPLVC